MVGPKSGKVGRQSKEWQLVGGQQPDHLIAALDAIESRRESPPFHGKVSQGGVNVWSQGVDRQEGEENGHMGRDAPCRHPICGVANGQEAGRKIDGDDHGRPAPHGGVLQSCSVRSRRQSKRRGCR
jgi:hypothetical protein